MVPADTIYGVCHRFYAIQHHCQLQRRADISTSDVNWIGWFAAVVSPLAGYVLGVAISRSALTNALASAGGTALAATFRLAGALRPSDKPLHPRGRLMPATLRRRGLDPSTGVDWIDLPGTDQVVVRGSRAMGLPANVPDIHGLAIRVPLGPDHVGDLLFATTGTGAVTRYTLTLARSPQQRAQTTLMPYRSPTGPLLLAAVPRGRDRFDIACASPRGRWRTFAELEVDPAPLLPEPDPTISFDPVLNQVPRLEPYEWVRRLREGSYEQARRTR